MIDLAQVESDAQNIIKELQGINVMIKRFRAIFNLNNPDIETIAEKIDDEINEITQISQG